jgi:phospholipid-transporting ATPase
MHKDGDHQESHHNKVEIYFGESNPNLEHNKLFPNNKIVTTKYNVLTWAPKSLLMQFRRAANIYFLIISVLTFMSFSPKQPASMVGTFAFVLICTMIKELIEDLSRYKQDRQSNNRLVWKMTGGIWEQVKCWTLMPGDVIKVEKDDEFSADTLVLKSTNDNGYCYIDTKNLDGESNLKEKASLDEFRNKNEFQLHTVNGKIECEMPNENLSSWKGKIFYEDMDPVYCKMANLILKGCVLKNTEYICGIVVYSGKNTKIMKNSKSARIKMSKVLAIMNKLLYSLFTFELALCLTFAFLNYMWVEKNQSTLTYIFPKGSISEESTFLKFVKYFFTFFVAYSHMIPISLYVALELVKILQGLLITFDNDIFDYTIEKAANCRATDLIEELGQVEFIFSDKTGTLTQNVMVLKKVYLQGKVYGGVPDDSPDAHFTINGDVHLVKKLKSTEKEDMEEQPKIEEFLYLLSLCHAVFPEVSKDNTIVYQGASPDDIALVKGAQQIGVEFVKKDFDDMIIQNHINGESRRYEMKIEMPFDSDRKRMSVVVKDKETNEYILYSKGADTTMLPRITLDSNELEEINRVIKVLSKEGLRVLVMGSKILKESVYLEWEKRYKEARNNAKDDSLNIFYEELENNLNFLGCSAIEDKLQEGVGETIYTLLTCNIRVWVLTGDKQDTAEEIAKSCKLINENMFILYLVDDGTDTREKIHKLKEDFDINLEESEDEKLNLEEVSRKIRKKRGKDMSIVIDGFTLEIILSDEELSAYFFHVAIAAKSVVCCRVTPKQKSKVVSLAKNFGKWVTLSIGDGANDVPMIMEAHIGIGIQGKEGTQAVRSADFSIGQFRFLEKLLLTYGRTGYIKVSRFICYYFYKNIILIFTDILFNFQNGFSGQIYFADYFSTMYNAFFTSWPCLFTFSLERDVDINIVKRFPILYVAGQRNYFFNMKKFWSYIFYAIFHGFICFFLSNEGLVNSNDETGVTFNHWYKSTVSFSLVIHIVTYKLLIISDFWNGLSLFSTIFSIGFYYVVVLILCYNPISYTFQPEVAGLIYNVFGYSKFWVIVIIGPFLALVPDMTFKQIFYASWPNPTDYIKQHLRDPLFLSMINVEESHSIMFNSPEARKAEKVLKEILKKAREHKLKRRLNIIADQRLPFRPDSIRDNAMQYLKINENQVSLTSHSNSSGYKISSGKNSSHVDSSNRSKLDQAGNLMSIIEQTNHSIIPSKKHMMRKINSKNEKIKNLIKTNTFAKPMDFANESEKSDSQNSSLSKSSPSSRSRSSSGSKKSANHSHSHSQSRSSNELKNSKSSKHNSLIDKNDNRLSTDLIRDQLMALANNHHEINSVSSDHSIKPKIKGTGQKDQIKKIINEYENLKAAKNGKTKTKYKINRRSTDIDNNKETKAKIDSYLNKDYNKNKTMAQRVSKNDNFLRVDSISGSGSNSKKSFDSSLADVKIHSMRDRFDK